MFCRKCGVGISDDEKFCHNCGEQVILEVDNFKRKDGKVTISKILGIVSIVFSFILSVFVLPIAIVGLILGIKSKDGKKNSGVILNVIAIVFSILMFIVVISSYGFEEFFSKLYNELQYSSSSNFVAGEYNCTGVDYNKDEYLITLYLNKDMTFLYGPYGDLENNYVKGTYTFVDEKKTNETGDYKYFMVTFTGKKEDFIIDGISSSSDFNSEMEFGVTTHNKKKEGVVIFVSSYNMYYCYEK